MPRWMLFAEKAQNPQLLFKFCSLLFGGISFKIINNTVYTGAGCFNYTLLQILFLPTYTWT